MVRLGPGGGAQFGGRHGEVSGARYAPRDGATGGARTRVRTASDPDARDDPLPGRQRFVLERRALRGQRATGTRAGGGARGVHGRARGRELDIPPRARALSARIDCR